jgi:hypothetical protein
VKRRLLNLLTVLSLLLCVAAVALRFRAANVTDVWKLSAAGRCLLIRSDSDRWVEIGFVPRGWTDRGGRWWSVDRRAGQVNDQGPVILDYNITRRALAPLPPFRGEYGYSVGELWVMRGPDGRSLNDRTGNYAWAGSAWSTLATGSPASTYWLKVPATSVRAPFSAIALAAAVAPAARLVAPMRRRIRAMRRTRAARRGQCVRCGYDLTGNVSGTCPECGTAAVKA